MIKRDHIFGSTPIVQPPWLLAQTAAAIEAKAQAYASHVATMVPDRILDFGPDGVIELLSDSTMEPSGAGTRQISSPFGSQCRASLFQSGDEDVLVSSDSDEWQFANSSIVIAALCQFIELGTGGLWLGQCKGPGVGKPNYPGSGDYGDDLGMGISVNSDGGLGAQFNGDAGEVNICDGVWRWIFAGYSQLSHAGFAATMINGVIVATGANGAIGDCTSPDPFRIGGADTFNTLQAVMTGCVARVIRWTGTPADNITSYASAIVPAIHLDDLYP